MCGQNTNLYGRSFRISPECYAGRTLNDAGTTSVLPSPARNRVRAPMSSSCTAARWMTRVW